MLFLLFAGFERIDSTTTLYRSTCFEQSQAEWKGYFNDLPYTGVLAIGSNGTTPYGKKMTHEGERVICDNLRSGLKQLWGEGLKFDHRDFFGHRIVTVDLEPHVRPENPDHIVGDATKPEISEKARESLKLNSVQRVPLTYIELLTSALRCNVLTPALKNLAPHTSRFLIELSLDGDLATTSELEQKRTENPLACYHSPELFDLMKDRNDPNLLRAIELVKQIYGPDAVEQFFFAMIDQLIAKAEQVGFAPVRGANSAADKTIVPVRRPLQEQLIEATGKDHIPSIDPEFLTAAANNAALDAIRCLKENAEFDAMRCLKVPRRFMERPTQINVTLYDRYGNEETTVFSIIDKKDLFIKLWKVDSEPVGHKIMQLYSLFTQMPQIKAFFSRLGFDDVQHIECLGSHNGINGRKNTTYLDVRRNPTA